MTKFEEPVVNIIWPLPDTDDAPLISIYQSSQRHTSMRRKHAHVRVPLVQAEQLLRELHQQIARAKKGLVEQ